MADTYNTKSRKLNRIWTKQQENSVDLKKLYDSSIYFNSINFNKDITIIPIIDDITLPAGISRPGTEEILLKGFPDNFVETIYPIFTIDLPEPYRSKVVSASTGRVGEVYFTSRSWYYTLFRIDDKNFLYKIHYDINIRQNQSGFPSYINIPAIINCSLVIYNNRFYELNTREL